MEEEIYHCEYCKRQIRVEAQICHYCGKWQKSYKNLPWLGIFTVSISAILLILAFLQFQSSLEEQIDANKALVSAEDALKKADSTSQKLDKINDEFTQNMNFTLNVMKAQNDNKPAFDSLKKWSSDADNPLSKESKQYYNLIKSKLELETVKSPWGWTPQVKGFGEKERENILDVNQLIDFIKTRNSSDRVDIVHLIGDHKTNLTDNERNEFYIYIINNDNSLKVVERAAALFISRNKLPFSSMQTEKINEWYEKNM